MNMVDLAIRYIAISVSFLLFLLGAITAGIMLANQKGQSARAIFGGFSLSLSLWSLFSFLMQITTSQANALVFCKLLMFFAVFIPVFNLHHIYVLIGRPISKRVRALYILTIAVAFTCFSSFIVSGASPRQWANFWPDAGILLPLLLVLWFGVVLRFMLLLISELKNATGGKKAQLWYVLAANIVGWSGGGTNYLIVYGLNIPPVGNILVCLYFCIYAYAVIRYRLMDIRVAFSAAGIFLSVYSLTFGIPFWIYWKGYHLPALISAIALSTPAPFIYSRLKRRAEDEILKEERNYQDIIQRTAKSFTGKKTVDAIARSLVEIITRAIQVKSAAFYFYDGQKYVLKDVIGEQSGYVQELADDSPIVSYLKVFGAVHLDEIKQNVKLVANKKEVLDTEQISEFIKKHPASVALPIRSSERILGLLFIGEKLNNTQYSDRDLTALDNFAFPVGLAIENAMHIAMATKTIEEEMHDHRLRDMGVIGSAISHQVGNRLQLVTRFLETFARRFDPEKMAPLSREEILTKLNQSMEQFPEIIDNAIKAAEISDALRTQGKLSKDAHAVELKRLTRMARAIAEAKHPGFQYKFVEDFDENLKLWANESSMQDILFNLFDNSLDSIKIKMRDNSLPAGYAGQIAVRARPAGDMAIITVEDNGIGIRPEALEKAFVPHYTTKGTEKGTGLGLYIIHQFIRHSKGTIAVESASGEWAKFTIHFPLATEERLSAKPDGV